MIAAALLAVAAQVPATPPAVVTVPEPEEVRLVAGASAECRLAVAIRKGFRIQANPASELYLVPARIEIEPDARVRVGEPEYPPGRPYRLRGASNDLSVYRETFEIRIPLAASGPLDASAAVSFVLEGRLEYQACNDVMCLKPTTALARIPVRVEPGPEPPR